MTDESDNSLPLSNGYDDEGLAALYQLAAGDVVKVNGGIELELTTERMETVASHRTLWSRIGETNDGERRGIGVITSDGTYFFDSPDDPSSTNAISRLEIVETGDGVLCELHAVHEDGAGEPDERCEFIRAVNLLEAKRKYEERYGTPERFPAAYEDVDSKLSIIASEEGLE